MFIRKVDRLEECGSLAGTQEPEKDVTHIREGDEFLDDG